MNKETQLEIAKAMTSTAPPTNGVLLDRWHEQVQDQDLKNLISDWKKFAVTGEYKSSLECYNNHQLVHEKIKTDYYGS
ncbi:MAG TPA: hypothetical protein PJ987_09590 [Bacteroidia bacterium]|nr:hypothetical protein [Bacteroidia bacterium]HMY42168.1 hypothetical protein [Chitinophagales bacterium]